MPVTDSPLRYPGGKTQLAPFVIELMRANDLFHGHYAEPFAGGAGIAWKLLFDNYADEVWINDIDPAIHAFWSCVLDHTDDFCERIERTPITIEEWHRQRVVRSRKNATTIALGFATFFLNRTNRSGILSGGVIGGYEQKGNYALDCRFPKADLIGRIRRIALYRERIHLSRVDGEEFLRGAVKQLPRRSLVNVDPPYYRQGPDLYCSFYEHEDHMRLAQTVRALRRPWMLTYDDVPAIRRAYRGFPSITKALNYYAQVKRVGIEFMAFSRRLELPPDHEMPVAA